MTTEHVIPQSVDPSARNRYDNLVFACRFCNRARGKEPPSPGRRLLDPTVDAWADHFELVGSELRCRLGDIDAEETCRAYDLNDPIKVGQRTWRAKQITEHLEVLAQTPGLIAELTAQAGRRELSAVERTSLLHSARRLQRQLDQAREDLTTVFAAIPADHDAKCRCRTTEHHSLPDHIAAQTVSGLDS